MTPRTLSLASLLVVFTLLLLLPVPAASAPGGTRLRRHAQRQEQVPGATADLYTLPPSIALSLPPTPAWTFPPVDVNVSLPQVPYINGTELVFPNGTVVNVTDLSSEALQALNSTFGGLIRWFTPSSPAVDLVDAVTLPPSVAFTLPPVPPLTLPPVNVNVSLPELPYINGTALVFPNGTVVNVTDWSASAIQELNSTWNNLVHWFHDAVPMP